MTTHTSLSSSILRSTALLAAVTASVSGAIIDVPGNPDGNTAATSNLDAIVGAGNSGRLLGDFTTHWNPGGGGSFTVPVDTNGFVLHLDTGGGNAGHMGAGALSGSGSVTVASGPRWSGTWNVPYNIVGTTSNTFTGGITFEKGDAILNKTAGFDAIPGSATVGSLNDNARVYWGAGNQVSDSSGFIVITPNFSDGAAPDANLNFLDLAGFSETFASLTLGSATLNQVRTGAGGVLTLNSLTVAGTPMAPGTYTSSSSFVLGTGSIVVVPEPAGLCLALPALALLRRRR